MDFKWVTLYFSVKEAEEIFYSSKNKNKPERERFQLNSTCVLILPSKRFKTEEKRVAVRKKKYLNVCKSIKNEARIPAARGK